MSAPRRGPAPPDRKPARGSVTVEMAILTPAFLLLVVAAIVFGRVAVAFNAIDIAAHDAARAASISRTAPAAEANAEAAAHAALSRQGLHCVDGPQVVPETSAFTQEGPELAFVEVTIHCEVSFLDVALPGVPQSRLITARFHSPIDSYRER